MIERITVAKVDEEPGVWSAAEVARLLETGLLTQQDRFWREGMEAWTTLDQFSPPPRSFEAFAVNFDSAFAVDPLGFVGTGELLVSADSVEFVGRRRWPASVRLGVFLVVAPLVAVLIHQLYRRLPHHTAPFEFVGAYLVLFEVLGSPLLVFTLMHYFCTSPTSLRVPRATISGLTAHGRQVSFLVRPASGPPCRTRFRAETATAAAALVRLLSAPMLG